MECVLRWLDDADGLYCAVRILAARYSWPLSGSLSILLLLLIPASV